MTDSDSRSVAAPIEQIPEASPNWIQLRRQILDWRDKHILLATLALNRLWLDLKPSIDAKLEEVPWQSAIVAPSKYIKEEIDPLLASRLGPLTTKLIQEAHDELSSLIQQQLAVDATIADRSVEENHLETAVDLLGSLAPLAGGLAMGVALPSMAVVSGTAAFGLVVTSSVSVPILAGGIAMTSLAFATGVLKTSQLRALRARRMKARVWSYVQQAMLSPYENANQSVLARMIGSYQNAAKVALEGQR